MANESSETQEQQKWSAPAGAVAILMWRCCGYYGYRFISQRVHQINERTIEAINVDGFKFIMMGGEWIERTLSHTEQSLNECLGGIYNEEMFKKKSTTNSNESNEYIYEVYWKFQKERRVDRTKECIQILSKDSFSLNTGVNAFTVKSEGPEMFCEQLRSYNDQFDLSQLPNAFQPEPAPQNG